MELCVILVDDRAGSEALVPLLPPDLTKMLRLESGDVAFFGHSPEGQFTWPIGIEYKTVSETIQCITSRRFVGEQYPKMADLYKRIYFLMEGEIKEGPNGLLLIRNWSGGKPTWASYGWSVTYRQFDNWMNSLTETGNVIFKRSADRKESAAQVLNLYHLWTKDYDQHNTLFAFDKSQLPPTIEQPSLLRLMAAQIPGIGWKRSKEVEKHFSSPYEAFTAEEDVWVQVNGIGPTIAKRVVQLLKKNPTTP
jgi:ERCC4-type nuclease